MKSTFTYVLCAFLMLGLHVQSIAQDFDKRIEGVITDGQLPLADVSIKIQGNSTGTISDAKGKYSIKARPKDILVFSYVGMEPIEIIVEDVTKWLNVVMLPKVEELDEVVVSKRKKKTQLDLSRTYYSDSTIIRAGFKYFSPESVGFELRAIDGRNLNTKARDILDAIADQLPGVTVRTIQGERYLFPRSAGSLRGASPMVYEVDGVVLRDAPVGIDIRKVLRVGIIGGQQAFHMYGPIASPGIVIINTNNVNHGSREDGDRRFDQARLRGNIYTDKALDDKAVLEIETSYLKALYQCQDKEEALAVYDKYQRNFGSSYAFVVDVYRFFRERFNAKELANDILLAHEDQFKENAVALKALAYVLQTSGEYEMANKRYKELFVLRPDYAQSYLDLANSYREVGDYTKAVALYTRHNYLVRNNLMETDSTVFFPMIGRELNNLIALKGKEILSKKEIKDYVLEEDFKGIRLVFEWNDSEAEFELQFVNPKGHYYKTEHSLIADADRIRNEKRIGFSCEEFLIDETLIGTWQANVMYLGNKSLTPTYLKATIYYDYGSPSQKKEILMFRLGLKNTNQELFKIENTLKLVAK